MSSNLRRHGTASVRRFTDRLQQLRRRGLLEQVPTAPLQIDSKTLVSSAYTVQHEHFGRWAALPEQTNAFGPRESWQIDIEEEHIGGILRCSQCVLDRPVGSHTLVPGRPSIGALSPSRVVRSSSTIPTRSGVSIRISSTRGSRVTRALADASSGLYCAIAHFNAAGRRYGDFGKRCHRDEPHIYLRIGASQCNAGSVNYGRDSIASMPPSAARSRGLGGVSTCPRSPTAAVDAAIPSSAILRPRRSPCVSVRASNNANRMAPRVPDDDARRCGIRCQSHVYAVRNRRRSPTLTT